jgi:hypothetical protein
VFISIITETVDHRHGLSGIQGEYGVRKYKSHHGFNVGILG